MDKRRRRRSRERSPDVKKIKGRGVRHGSGLRSWKDISVKKKDPKAEAEVQSTTHNPDNWIQSEIKTLEPGLRTKSKKSPVWTHDKFDKLNRSPESEGSEESKVRESPTYMP